VHLVVEKVRPGRRLGGRLKINLHIDNDSAQDVDRSSDDVSILDSSQNSYSVDTDHSTVADSEFGDTIDSGD
jgi:hypothetical protein